MKLQRGLTLPIPDRREKEPISQSFAQDQDPPTCLEHDDREAKEISQILVDIPGRQLLPGR